MTRSPDNAQAARLWDKGGALDELVHRFTVGDDPYWDRELLYWDCLGSAAHARTIHRAGLLGDEELAALCAALREIAERACGGRVEIPAELEDGHTYLEAELTRACGAAGRKIHTARSRNDQVATAMRLLMRARALDWLDGLDAFIAAALARIARDGALPMPGYTHFQPAMPSSVGQWLHAHAEAALDQVRAAVALLERLDACPLGTAAGFGAPVELDRAYTAGLLGFSRVQRSPIDVQNARGRVEQLFVRVAADIGAVFEKLGWDLVLFSTPALGFVVWPDTLTTGSSIMPQKKNPDVAELMRARGARLRGWLHELEWVAGKLPSSYHRDAQLTKPPTLRAAHEADALLAVATRVVERIGFDGQRLRAAMTPELYATHAAIERVRAGAAFRDAYREVADALQRGDAALEALPARYADAGRVRPTELDELRSERGALRARVDEIRRRVQAAEGALL